MNDYVESKIKTDVKHMINLQNLLNKYDHENKHLNKQICTLLEENKNLKQEKLKNNLFCRINVAI